MEKSLLALTILLAVTASTTLVKAQVITPGTVTADTNVDASGTAVLAAYFIGGTGTGTEKVNGVEFAVTASNNPEPTLTANGVTFKCANQTAAANGATSAGISPVFSRVLGVVAYNSNSGDITLTFQGLKPKHKYELQIFAGSQTVNVSETVADKNASGVLTSTTTANGYVIDTFTAEGNGVETVTIYEASNGFALVNAVNLRDVTASH